MSSPDRVLLRRAEQSVGYAMLLAFCMAGLLFWLMGALDKVILMALGRPTFPWRDFLVPESLAVEALIGTILSLPHLVMVLLGRAALRRAEPERMRQRKETEVVWALRGGSLGVALLGAAVFWEYDPIVFLAIPYMWAIILVFAVSGLLVGRMSSRRGGAPG